MVGDRSEVLHAASGLHSRDTRSLSRGPMAVSSMSRIGGLATTPSVVGLSREGTDDCC